MAGVVGFKDADLLEARVYRGGKEISKVNLEDLLNGSALDADTPLVADDVISIASVPMVRVWVTGSVRNPGPLVVPLDASVDQAIAQAGGAALAETNEGLAIRTEYRVLLRRGTNM